VGRALRRGEGRGSHRTRRPRAREDGPFFDEAALIDEERRGAGHSDLVDGGFREDLRVLLDAYARTARFDARRREERHARHVSSTCPMMAVFRG